MKRILPILVLFLTTPCIAGDWFVKISAIAAVHKNAQVRPETVQNEPDSCPNGQCEVPTKETKSNVYQQKRTPVIRRFMR